MKFRAERDVLAEAVGVAQRAVSGRAGALPVLSGLLLRTLEERVEIVGSDLEMTITTQAAVDVVEPGTVVVNARLFGDIVRSLDTGVVVVEGDEEQTRISSGRSDFSLRVLPAHEFPAVTRPEGGGVKLSGDALTLALRQVVPAASRDDARPILTGVKFEPRERGLRLVATDSYRLAVRDLEGEQAVVPEREVLVPARALGELQRLIGGGEVTVRISEREASFEMGTVEIVTRLIDGEFPNYEQLLPSAYPNKLTVARDAFLEAVRRVRLVAQGREGAPVRLSLSPQRVELAVVAADVGEAHELVEAKYEGEEMTVAFNPEFLLDGASVVETEELVLETLEPLKPATIRGVDGDGFLYLLMPVRVS